MSLSARIAVRPSRRMAILGIVVPAAGLAVLWCTAIVRWPALGGAWTGLAVLAVVTLLVGSWRQFRRSTNYTLTVSDRAELAVASSDPSIDGAWRLVESTLAWPRFSLLALRSDLDGRVVRLPVFDADLSVEDRRALRRFLLWALRGGDTAGREHDTAAS